MYCHKYVTNVLHSTFTLCKSLLFQMLSLILLCSCVCVDFGLEIKYGDWHKLLVLLGPSSVIIQLCMSTWHCLKASLTFCHFSRNEIIQLQSLLAPASCIIGLGRKHTGTRVFQEGQEKERLPHTFIQFQEEIKSRGMIGELGCAMLCARVYVCCCLHRWCRSLSVCVLACIYVTAYNIAPVAATLLVVGRPAQQCVSANTVTQVTVHLTMSVA